MQIFSKLHKNQAVRQTLIRLGFLLVLMMVVNLLILGISAVIAIWVWDYNFFNTPGLLGEIENPGMLPVLRFFQGMQSVGIFLIPGILWIKIYEPPLGKGLQIKNHISSESWVAMFLLVVAALPMINALAAMNEAMNLPQWLDALEQNLKAAEAQAMEFMKALLNTSSVQALFVNLLVVAVLPAISEEIIFRGILQNEMERVTLKPVLSVIIAALVFAAVHYQFYTFLPRFALGVMLGLVYLWSRNLWIPVILHFFNNGLSVLAWFYFSPDTIDKSIDNIGTLEYMWPMAIVSTVLVVILLFGIQRHFRKHARN